MDSVNIEEWAGLLDPYNIFHMNALKDVGKSISNQCASETKFLLYHLNNTWATMSK